MQYIVVIVAVTFGLGRTFDEVDEKDAGVVGKASFLSAGQKCSLTRDLAGGHIRSFLLPDAGSHQVLGGYVMPQAFHNQHEEEAASM